MLQSVCYHVAGNRVGQGLLDTRATFFLPATMRCASKGSIRERSPAVQHTRQHCAALSSFQYSLWT